MKKIIIISISSDIGTAMAGRYLSLGWKVYGTYRNKSGSVKQLAKQGAVMVRCDLAEKRSIRNACRALMRLCGKWDVLIMAPGSQDPVGPFNETDFDKWEGSVKVNFISQMRMLHELLPARRMGADPGPCVLFFAGGGTNNATVNYSAYTVSKIALIKMCELLDAEMPDTRFVILGPGWVKTKIHRSTLKAGKLAGANYRKTLDKLAGKECTPLEEVLDCSDWLIRSPRKIVGGRNFSVVYDAWGSEQLTGKLKQDKDMYKLRRSGNNYLVRGKGK